MCNKKYSLTTPQINIYNVTNFFKDSSIGNIGGTVTLDMEGLTSVIIEKAINCLIEASEGLRLRIHVDNDAVYQSVAPYEYESIPTIDVSNFTDKQIDKLISSKIRTAITYEGKLYRFEILQKSSTWLIFVTTHHIISDAWSMTIMHDSLIYSCQSLIRGEKPVPNITPYTEYIQKENNYFTSKRYEKDKTFWTEVFSESPNCARLKPHIAPSTMPTANCLSECISPSLSLHIREFCSKHEFSPAIVFEAAMLIYLDRINCGKKIPCIGLAVLNRDGAKDKRTVGMFTTTIPLKITPPSEKKLAEFCSEINDLHLQIYHHQKYPYSHLISDIQKRYNCTEKLFDVLMSYQNVQNNTDGNTRTKWYQNGNSEFSLAIHIDDRDSLGTYNLNIVYQTEQFYNESEVILLKDRILYIIEQIILNDHLTVSEVDVLSPKERALLLYKFNETESTYPRNKCLHTLFCEEVQINPNKPAVVCDDRKLTYIELDHMSNNLASILNINVGEIVALLTRRSELILVVQLAVLKSGGIFMPIDPSSPDERIADILDDCNAKITVVDNHNKNRLSTYSGAYVINIDSINLNRYTSEPVQVPVTADMGAHIVYTSGSTGKPKGSILTHRGLVNFAYHNLVICPGKHTYKSSISINTVSFDMFLCETIIPLVAGITVHIATEKQQIDQRAFAEYVKKHSIQMLQTTPTRYKILTSDKSNLNYLDTFKAILLSGEPFTKDIYHEIRANSRARIFNTCGPSENHIWICGCELSSDDITLGYPVRNTQIYILDSNQNIMPIGVPGELCVSGDCIGLGYINRPELNNEKYMPHPFISGKLLYKTGDLALVRPDGIIEHLGRTDTQVKIRGLRVELGEIEHNICSFDGVTNAAVTIVKFREKDFLCAFYQSHENISQTELKTHLSKLLPGYMIPNLFIQLVSLPMTSSGKVSRSNLEEFDISEFVEAAEHKEPVTELQKMLCKEFERLLQISPVSINLDFFSAGGNSLHIIDLISRLPEEFRLSAIDIYNHPTVESLAEYIEFRHEKTYESFGTLAKGNNKQVIICFPFAGSDESAFIELASELQKELPTVTIYGLHRANWTEINLTKAVEELSDIIENAETIMFYSHCAGAAMALKLYQHLPDPSKIGHIFIGGNIPPTGIRLYGKYLNPWNLMRDKKILRVLKKAGMNPDIMSDYAKTNFITQFRLDTKCYFHEMALLKGPFSVPCTLIVSDADRFTKHIDKARPTWQRYFKHIVDVVVINGANHYFHTHRAQEIARLILGNQST